mgnify:FL=1
MTPVRFGVIAAGRMAGYTMLNIMREHPAVVPVAWYEIDPARPDTAERIAKLDAAGIDRAATLEALLARDDLDVVLSATPHYAHAETSIAALDAGHPVLCEKPPACDLAQCNEMIRAARRNDRPLLVHFQHLLRPSARWLNRALCQGRLGRIRRVTCRSLWFRETEYYRRVAWAGRRYYQGRPTLDGTMTNQAVHFINQALALAERTGEAHLARPGELRAALYRFHPGEALEMEDTAVAVGTLDNADRTEFALAVTTCASGSEGPDRLSEYKGLGGERHEVVLECDGGRAIWNGQARIEPNDGPAEVFDEPEGPWPFYFHLQNVLAGAEVPVTPIEQSSRVMEMVFAIYEAAGEQIAQRNWAQHADVAEVLTRCLTGARLPAELDSPPAWV